jgi:predicted HTH domain antitoxin
MNITINIPKDQEQTLRNAWGSNLDRAALEALAIEGYRSQKLSAAEVGRLLGIEDRWLVNQWLADRKVPLNYTLEDLDSDRKNLDRILGKSA